MMTNKIEGRTRLNDDDDDDHESRVENRRIIKVICFFAHWQWWKRREDVTVFPIAFSTRRFGEEMWRKFSFIESAAAPTHVE